MPVTTLRGHSIGAVAERTGVGIETVRYYEKIGLIPLPARTTGGNRQYDEPLIRRVAFVKRCRDLGFSIAEIRTLLDMVDRDDIACGEVHALTIEHLKSVEAKIASLSRMRDTLRTLAAGCESGTVPDCPIIEAMNEPVD